MADFSSDVGTIHKGAAVMDSTRADIKSDLDKLRNVISDLITVGWGGRASQAFGQKMADWDTQADKLQAAMENIASLLRRTGDTFSITEEEQLGLVQRAMDYSGKL